MQAISQVLEGFERVERHLGLLRALPSLLTLLLLRLTHLREQGESVLYVSTTLVELADGFIHILQINQVLHVSMLQPVQKEVIGSDDASSVVPEGLHKVLLSERVVVDLEEARAGIVALRLLFYDQELLNRLRFTNVAHRLEKVLATVDVKLLCQRGKHAAEHHVAGAGAT